MSDCLLALQQCSLIGLDESPQLLRRSMLSSNKPAENTTAPQQLDFTDTAYGNATAGAPAGPDDQMQHAGSSSVAAAVTAAAAGRGAGSWLDCSLPLLASESPAIAGTKPPRSRFRRAAAAPAAAAAGQPILAAVGQQQVSHVPAHGDTEAAAAGLPGHDAYTSGDISCSFAAKGGMPVGSYVRGASDTDCDADCNPAGKGAAHAAPGAAAQPKEQPADWDLLQQLLDDSSCSSMSCLPAALAQQQSPAPAASPAAAAQGIRNSAAWRSPDAAGRRELTRSIGSDTTGFRGFWSATPGAQSQAAFSPAPMGQPSAHMAAQDGSDLDSQTPYAYANTDAAGAAAKQASAAFGGAQMAGASAQQERNTALMMLLSLEDSAVLGRTSCAEDGTAHAQLPYSSPIPEGTPGAELESPSAAQAAAAVEAAAAAAAEAVDVASPDTVPGGQLLRQQNWGAVGAQGASSRYTADCWPSPDGSPGVLLSSPVLDGARAGAAGSPAPPTASRFAPAAADAAATEDSAQVDTGADGSLGAGEPVPISVPASAAAAGGSRVAALRAMQQPNALEYSPIRGLTLWADASIPDAAQPLQAAAAASNAAADSLVLEQSQQQEQEAPGSSAVSGSNSSSRHTSSAVVNQFEQLQRLLTSSSTSSEDWQEADNTISPAAEDTPAMESPSTQQQQEQLGSPGEHAQCFAASVASKLHARSPGLHVLVGEAVEAGGSQQNSCTGAGTANGSPNFYTPADTPQTEQLAMPLPATASAAGLQQEQQEEELPAPASAAGLQQEQEEEEMPAQIQEQECGSTAANLDAVASPAAAAAVQDGSSSPAGSAQSGPSPLRVRTLPGEAPESPRGTPAKSPSAAAAASAAGTPGDSSTATPVSARGRMSPLQLRASPAESMDSFYGAAAGDPYSSIALEGSASKLLTGDPVRRSITWHAYDGLGSLLENEQPPTPGSVMCKKAWGASGGGSSAVGTAGSSCAGSSNGSSAQSAALAVGQRSSSSGGAAAAETAAPGTASAEGAQAVQEAEQSPSKAAADLASLVSLLKQQLRQAELRCTQQQLSVNEARQLVLHKELEVERLKAGLVKSEQEGTGCLEALEAALDIMTTADGMPDTSAHAAMDPAAAGSAAEDGSGGAELAFQQQQQQFQALQDHNTELQSTLAEAGQQVDYFESQLQQLTAEKAAVEGQLAAAQERLAEQQAQHEAFLQSELDERQQQHEEEVGQLHERLRELQEQMQALREAAAASKAAAEQSQVKAASLQQQQAAGEEHIQGLAQQLEQLQAVLTGQESESAASSEQLSRQVAQLLAAQQELQQANARLLEAEAEYASNQLSLGCRNQELNKQLQDAVANNKRLDETNHQLQAQNASLSQMVQSLRAQAAAHGASAATAAGAATPTSTAQSRSVAGAAPAPGMEGPTPMRRRMASVNAQLERRVQELLQQKQALAAQVEQLQQQLGQQPAAAAASTGLTEQQQAAWDELQAQVEHLTNCNDELVQQLEELDWAHEQLQAEKLDLDGRLLVLEQDRQQLLTQVQQLQQQAESASTAAVGTDGTGVQVQKLQTDKDRLSQDFEQLQDRLAQALQQLQALKEQQDANQNNTALFERCKELKAQVHYLQQQLQQREAQVVRSSVDGMRSPAAADQQQELQFLRRELRELQEESAQQEAAHRAQEQQLHDRCEQMAAELGAAQQQLLALQAQLDDTASSKAQLAANCSSLKQAVADADARRLSAQESMVSLKDRNRSLVDQLVQMQLATPAHKPVSRTAAAAAATAKKGAQTAADSTAAHAEAQRPPKRRWTLDAGVQVEMGGTDAEQATAVQQLLLLQAQAQLHEMEEQNRQAAQRHVDSKQRIAQLQSSLTQQDAALQAAEQKLRDAQQTHGRESASLQHENDQLVRQLADTRVQLQVLQTANAHLDSRVQQQQKDLQQHAAAAKEARLKVQELAHQQNLDQMQVAAVTAELTACKNHAQQLMVAQEKEARAVAALQQKLQQAQQEGQKASAAAMATGQAAYAALEGRLGREVHASKEQVDQLMRDKNTLMLELQQTKATVNCLEDSVRRLGQHNAHLVQQIKDSLAAADSNTTGATAVLAAAAAAAGAGASMLTPTSAPTSAAGAGSMYTGASSGSVAGAGKQQAAKAGGGPVSPRTLHSIIAAATRVNEKNKKLKRQLMAMQAPPS